MRATVAIPTFNGQEFLDEVLRVCVSQQAAFPFEVLVLDSGSTDRTLDIVSRHPGVRLYQIPNNEFGHGRTRNLAAALSKGDIVVFLTQDATPTDPGWLGALLAPFDGDPRLAGVFARQIPRAGCGPTTSREVMEVFRDPPAGFFSNVCSAVRRAALTQVPFRDVSYAEDQAFAADVCAAGWHVAYAPSASVRHSHNLRLGEYFRRMFDEAQGVSALGRRSRTDLRWLAGATVRGTFKDWGFLVESGDYPPLERMRWALKVPSYNAARRTAIWLASRRLPEGVGAFLSLDERRRAISS